MKTRTSRRTLSLAMGGLTAALTFSAINAQAQQTINLGHTLSDSSHYSVGADAFKETLERLSDGEFKIAEHPSGSLGGERAMIEGLQIGTVDVVITSTGPLGNFVPESYALDLPFLFKSYEQARCTLDGEIGQSMLDKMGEHNLVGLAWSENGFRHITNSKKPVKTPADLADLKIRTMENKVHMEAFEQMKAHPTPMAFPEVFTALQQGTVDGQENPITVIVATKFWEVQPYLSLTGHVYSPAIVLGSPVLMDGLNDKQRGWFFEAAKASAEATRAEVTRLEKDGVKLLRDKGMTVETDIDKAPFQKAAEPAYKIYTDQYGTEILNRIKASDC